MEAYVSEKSQLISKLLTDKNMRTAYIKAKVGVLVPSQIRALRLKSGMPRQADLAREAEMQQSRISMFETPGGANVTLETLARLAAIFKVGLIVKFAPFSEMLHWENTFSQDRFDVVRVDHDQEFLDPTAVISREVTAGVTTAVTAGVTTGVTTAVTATGRARMYASEASQTQTLRTGSEMQTEGILGGLGTPLSRQPMLSQ